MPCNSDYLRPTAREAELQRAAQLYVYVLERTEQIVPRWLCSSAHDIYTQNGTTVALLCDTLRAMSPEQIDAIVYNAHDRQARDLADWWEEHQEADRQRQEKEAEAVRTAQLRAAALQKLTIEERQALGL